MRKMTRRFLPLILAISVVVLLFAWIQLRLHLHVVEQRADSLESTFMDERSYIDQLKSANASFRGENSELEAVVGTLGSDLKEQIKANAALRDKIRLMLGSEIEAQATKIRQQKKIKRLLGSEKEAQATDVHQQKEIKRLLGSEIETQATEVRQQKEINRLLGSEKEAQATEISQQNEINRLRKELQQLRDKQPPLAKTNN